MQIERLVRLYTLLTHASPEPVGLAALVNAATRYPHITQYIPDTLDENACRSADLLGLHKERFVDVSIRKKLALLTLAPETIGDNVKHSCEVLGVDKAALVQAGCKQPTLFVLRPETIAAKLPYVQAITSVLGENKTVSDSLRASPLAFVSAPKRLHLRYILAKNGHGTSLNQLVNMSAQKAEATAVNIYRHNKHTLRMMYATGLITTLPASADLTKTPEPAL